MEHEPVRSGPLESLITASTRRRGITLILVILAAAAGLGAYRGMRRNVYPEITIPVFTIVTENEAMAAEEVETLITRPMESAMNGLPGVRRIRSQTTQGLSSVVVEFDIETEFWRARQFVGERMAQVVAQLPAGTEPSELSSATTRLAEVFELAVEGEAPLEARRRFAEQQLRLALQTVGGVADVVNMGGYLRQFRVTLNPARMASYGVSLGQIEEALRSGNENAAGGFVSTGPTEYVVRGIGRLESIADLRDIVIGQRGGVPVHLVDVAEVREGTAIRRGIARMNGKETVVCLVVKQPDADTIAVVEGIERTLGSMKASIPSGMQLVPYFDQTHLIRESLDGVTRALWVGALLVVLVLAVFLGDLRATLAVAASLPLSVLIGGSLMERLGVGINTMSLGGLAISVGIMVDASIIMVENIHHRLQSPSTQGYAGPLGAAIEVGRPIAFATLIIVSVFLPLLNLGGIEGLLFRPLAITVAVAMLSALALSLTFTPMVAGAILRRNPRKADDDVALVRAIKRAYAPMLDWALRHRGAVIGLSVVMLAGAGVGLSRVGRDFMPKMDEGAMFVSTITPADTSLEENDRITRQAEEALLRNPAVAQTVKRVGHSERVIGCVLPVNVGEIIVNLRRGPGRSGSGDPVEAARDAVESIPGMGVAFSQPFQNKVDESLQGTPAALQVKLFGPDIGVLQERGRQIEAAMRRVRGLRDIKPDQIPGVPQMHVRVDRRRAARYGVSPGVVSEAVRLGIGGEELTEVWQDQRGTPVFVRLPDSLRDTPEAVGNLLVDTVDGARVPLAQVADIQMTQGPNVIWREALGRRFSIDAGIEGRDVAGVVADIQREIAGVELPEGYSVVYGGEFENAQRAMRSVLVAALAALAVVFVLLYAALGSPVHAGVILATVPSAFVGGVASLLVSGETLNVSSAVGFIALFGIAVQNSLVLLVQANDFSASGMSRIQAITLAGVQRVRPKLMTALCAALGLLPILLSRGAGAELERPLATVMVGGLVTSTLFTLFVLPAVVALVDRARLGAERAM